jgi:hypothetical protein
MREPTPSSKRRAGERVESLISFVKALLCIEIILLRWFAVVARQTVFSTIAIVTGSAGTRELVRALHHR